MKAACSEDEFIRIWKRELSATAVAKVLKTSVRAVNERRRRIESTIGYVLPVFDPARPRYTSAEFRVSANHSVVNATITDGMVIIGSDAHIWPGELTTMQRAFLQFARDLKPTAIIANGDFFDGARASRWAHSSWGDMGQKPSIRQELDAVKDYMSSLVAASPQSKRFWPLGNHDARYEAKIIALAPEYEGVPGLSLKDHFSMWTPCWRVDINDDVIVRHRELGGEHADFRNTVNSGKSMVTGHDHRTGVTPWRNYRGTQWGVRCGYLGDSPQDPQFVNYLEAKEPNWHPAFVVLTFKDGRLLWPELVTKHDDAHVQFRGKVIAV